MVNCEYCGGRASRAVRFVASEGNTRCFDCVECALAALSPPCARCGESVGPADCARAGGLLFCSESCAVEHVGAGIETGAAA
jgi:hypothetical protein